MEGGRVESWEAEGERFGEERWARRLRSNEEVRE